MHLLSVPYGGEPKKGQHDSGLGNHAVCYVLDVSYPSQEYNLGSAIMLLRR